MKESINICYVLNDNPEYKKLTLDSIKSIKTFFRDTNSYLTFYILSENPVHGFEKVAENIISPYKDIPLLWQRMYISELLGKERVIFLDSDTLIYTCISKLWKTDLQNNVVAMAPHYCMSTIQEMLDHYNLNEYEMYRNKRHVKRYYNAGVVVIDCKEWLQRDLTSACMKLYTHIRNSKHYRNDEPTYNVLLDGMVHELDISWNYFPTKQYKRVNLIHYYGMYTKDKPNNDVF